MSQDFTIGFADDDIEQNKTISLFAYILFFIPLLAAKESKFARFHANQGLILFLFAVIISIVSSVIPILGWFIIGPLGSLFVVALAVLGIINAVGGKAKQLPLIGNFELLK
ncbi:DUF4870 domain-containing protein [Candidatus Kapaibacterium sp.]